MWYNYTMNLDEYKQELETIENFLAEPNAYSSPDFPAKNKRANTLREIIALNQKITQLKSNLKEAESLINDPDLGEIAKDDISHIKTELDSTTAKLKELLIPHDPEDDKPAIIEIRAGAGGDEASLFAA